METDPQAASQPDAQADDIDRQAPRRGQAADQGLAPGLRRPGGGAGFGGFHRPQGLVITAYFGRNLAWIARIFLIPSATCVLEFEAPEVAETAVAGSQRPAALPTNWARHSGLEMPQ